VPNRQFAAAYHPAQMLSKLLKAKIHRATVTQTDPEYHGSITIDPLLLEASGMMSNEAVLIADCDNGNRFETYIIPGEPGSGVIGINGAAALLTGVGHKVIIITFGHFDDSEVAEHRARVILVDEKNRLAEVIEHETQSFSPAGAGASGL
jgi:aspartate 1-decarboxylase